MSVPEFRIEQLQREVDDLKKQIKSLQAVVTTLKRKVDALDTRTVGSIRVGGS